MRGMAMSQRYRSVWSYNYLMGGHKISRTRVRPTRFLLDSDPATPATPMVPSGTITAAPTLSGPYKSAQWSLELDLADLENYP